MLGEADAKRIPTTTGIWETSQWIVALQGDDVYRQQFHGPAGRGETARRLAAGESPQTTFGRSGQRLPLDQIRGLAWVPAVRTVLIYRGWWRDKWRLTFDDGAAGEQFFRTLATRLPGAGPPSESRVGPDDLHLDPRFGVAILLMIGGLCALIGGAVEGLQKGQFTGPGRGWLRVFEALGAAVGVEGAIAIGATVFIAGVFSLAWWYRNRPSKWVVTASSSRA